MSAARPSDPDAAGPDVGGTVFDDDQPEVTRSYAEALLAAAVDPAAGGGDAEAVLDELDELVADLIQGQPRFAAMLAATSLPAEEKDRVLTRVLEGRTLPLIVRFLRVLNRHGRLGHVAAIARQARGVWDHRQNRRPVLVRSAVPLDDAQRAALYDRLGRMLAATPQLSFQVDPSLLGGLVVQVGDDVYDASVARRLQQLRHRLIEGKKHEIQSRRDQFSHS
jgi:F-type H+-transporting ATPase subunit delta